MEKMLNFSCYTRPVFKRWLCSWTSVVSWSHEHLITKFRLKLNKVGKTTRPFRYDLFQIPYNYTVEVTNRFKGLHLIECLKKYGQQFLTLYRRWWSKPSQEKEMQKGKMVVWGSLTISCEKNRNERQRRKGKI